MQRRLKVVIIVLLGIAVLVPSILAYASETKTYFFSRDLQVTDFVAGGTPNMIDYGANVSDSGTLIADLYFRIEPLDVNSTARLITFQIAHWVDSQFDSMTLRFSVEPMVLSIYLGASSYDWPGARFITDSGDVLYSVPDIGWYGSGTLTLKFIMDSYGQNVNLGFTVDLSMHMNAVLQLTSLKAHAYLSTPVLV